MKRISFNNFYLLSLFFALLIASACKPTPKEETVTNDKDTSLVINTDTTIPAVSIDTNTIAVNNNANPVVTSPKKAEPKVIIYNFHLTNRCASCIAIEEATTKTLNTYFPAELKKGIIKRYIVNVDEPANKALSEKYQAYGSGIMVVSISNGKENVSDLTGDGFRFARLREERFIEILKSKIYEDLK